MLTSRLRKTAFIPGLEARAKGRAGTCSATRREASATEVEATAAERSGTRSDCHNGRGLTRPVVLATRSHAVCPCAVAASYDDVLRRGCIPRRRYNTQCTSRP